MRSRSEPGRAWAVLLAVFLAAGFSRIGAGLQDSGPGPVPVTGYWSDLQTFQATFYNPGPGKLELRLRRGEILWDGDLQDQWLVLLDDELELKIPEGGGQNAELAFVCGDPRLRHPAERADADLRLGRFLEWEARARRVLDIEKAWRSLASSGALRAGGVGSVSSKGVLQWAVWADAGATASDLLALARLQTDDPELSQGALAFVGADVATVLETSGSTAAAAWSDGLPAISPTAAASSVSQFVEGWLTALKAPPAPTIEIIEIAGLRKNTLGDFSAEGDPDVGGRLFVDTTDAGDINATVDRQRVKITARITPANLNPAQHKVRWELRDPDDPAAHADVDSNGATGGDNTGTAHEGSPHWFSRADHNISGEMDRAAVDETTVIGEALTDLGVVGGRLVSTVNLHYTDDGGDNFVVRAVLVKAGRDLDRDDTGTLTVWRKRTVEYWAMRRPLAQGGVYDIFGAAGRNTFAQAFGNSDADLNCYLDLVTVDGGPGNRQPVRIGSGDETFILLKNTRFEMSLNGGAAVRLTLNPANNRAATAAEVRNVINGGLAGNPSRLLDANRKVIVEARRSVFVDGLRRVPDPSLQVFLWNEDRQRVSGNQMALLNDSYLPEALTRRNTAFHSNDAHAHRRYVVQLAVDEGSPNLAAFGQTEAPHSVVRFRMHKTAAGRISTAVHECGHSFSSQATGFYHATHAAGKDCAAKDGKESAVVVFCPKHARDFRNCVNRGWTVGNVKEAG